MSIAKSLLNLLREHLAKRAYLKKKEQTLSKFGWDCTCPGCKRLMHTDETVAAFHETDMHWHYLCKCGYRSAWHLYGPVPMYDPSYTYKNLNPLGVL